MGKTACIAGAAGGLGIKYAQVCLEHGYMVLGGDLNGNESVEKLKEQYKDSFYFQPVDLGTAESVEEFSLWVKEHCGSIDILMNAAGVYTQNCEKVFEEFDIEQSIFMYNINALGPLRIIQNLIELVEKSEDKLVVSISSEAASMASPVMLPFRYDYGMSKAALNLATTILQRYYKPKGIKFLLFHPGWMRTAMGGENAIVDPADSAAGIFETGVRMMHQLDESIFFDYNGTPRPW